MAAGPGRTGNFVNSFLYLPGTRKDVILHNSFVLSHYLRRYLYSIPTYLSLL